MDQTTRQNTMKKDPRKILTPPFRMNFPVIPPMEPQAMPGSTKKKYGLSMLFSPTVDMRDFKSALTAALSMKFGPVVTDWPRLKRGVKDIIRDFEEYNAETKTPLEGDWTGWHMVRANCMEDPPPEVIGQVKGADGKFPRITDHREVYSGRWACASIEAFFYPGGPGIVPGVTFGLRSVQLLKHDTRFGMTRSTPEDTFEEHPEAYTASDDYERGSKPAEDGSPW
jgi:hypothetical protein